jgi:hypothetical protein
VAQKVKMPSGKFIIEIDIADQEGARTFQRYYLQVHYRTLPVIDFKMDI